MVQVRYCLGLAVLSMTVGALACATPPRDKASHDPVLQDLQSRVDKYAALEGRLAADGPVATTTADHSKTEAAQAALAARLQAARAQAQQGDIFAPHIAARLRQLLNTELRGDGSAATRGAIRDEETAAQFEPKVNAMLPDGPRTTMPANVLRVLPRLPEELEYRIVDRHLLLVDAQTNVVVDYIRDVM